MAQPDDSDVYTPRQLHFSRFLVLCAGVFVALAALAGGLSGLGTQWGWWRFQTGFAILQWATYGAIAAAALGLVGLLSALFMRRGRLMAGAAGVLLVALAVVAVPLSHLQYAQSVPPIHDITTDTQDPPQFRALAPAREAAMNEVAYPGAETARQQRRAYPTVAPLVLDADRRAVFDAALAVARDSGWTIASAEPQPGRIEATAETFWYGFKDDVAIRIRETDQGRVRVDVRSASRVGISDLGVNAARIRSFTAELERRVGG
jgi:uncharacterized protein (DUF1499 family)